MLYLKRETGLDFEDELPVPSFLSEEVDSGGVVARAEPAQLVVTSFVQGHLGRSVRLADEEVVATRTRRCCQATTARDDLVVALSTGLVAARAQPCDTPTVCEAARATCRLSLLLLRLSLSRTRSLARSIARVRTHS